MLVYNAFLDSSQTLSVMHVQKLKMQSGLSFTLY